MKKTGTILTAAGLSSRMKDFEPLLLSGDTTIAFHITSVSRRLGADPVLAVTGYRAEELEDHLKGTGAYFTRNTRYRHTQMFDSVKSGIRAAPEGCERILAIPAGLPAITDDTIKQVTETPEQTVRTVYDDEPRYPICTEEEIVRRVYTYIGDRGPKGAIEVSGVSVENLEAGNGSIYLDVDTREEHRELLRWVCRQEPNQRRCKMH